MGFIHKLFILIVSLFPILNRDIDHYEELFKKGSGEKILNGLKKKHFKDKYLKNIERIIDFFEKYFGANFSFPAFENHLKLSYVYSIAFFLVGYLLYNEYAIENMVIMPSADHWWMRFGYTTAVLP